MELARNPRYNGGS